MKNILVPVDFSKASLNAAEYAGSLAVSFGATVTFINVVAPPVIIEDSVLASVMVTQAEILDKSKKQMEKEVTAFSEKYVIKAKGFVREGFPVDIISEMAAVKHADLIVMGMKGKGKSNSIFGSTSTAVIRKLSLPVLVIPEKAGYAPVNNITFASDFDATTEMKKYKLLIELAEKFNSQINILNVQKNDSSLSPEKAIGKMKAGIAFSKTKHLFHTISEKGVEEGIQKFLKKNPADILAMVAYRHNLFERLFGKVHTKKMSYQTKIPLLVLQGK
jgi:nucleotide-binding universal stress UspA family protein